MVFIHISIRVVVIKFVPSRTHTFDTSTKMFFSRNVEQMTPLSSIIFRVSFSTTMARTLKVISRIFLVNAISSASSDNSECGRFYRVLLSPNYIKL